MGGNEFSPAEVPWQVHGAAEVWFAHPDPNHHSQLAPSVIASLAPLWGMPPSSCGSRGAPSAVLFPLVMASTVGASLAGGQAEGVDVPPSQTCPVV